MFLSSYCSAPPGCILLTPALQIHTVFLMRSPFSHPLLVQASGVCALEWCMSPSRLLSPLWESPVLTGLLKGIVTCCHVQLPLENGIFSSPTKFPPP